ncbi:MAG: endoribonuclease family protein [Paucimonas sp.]|nr:endoribonuclease family protein [Paucimonas sp.]
MNDIKHDIKRIDQNARRSRAIVHNGLVYLSGQVPDDRSGGVADQARQVLGKIDDLLAEAGTNKARLLSAQVWLKTMDDFAAFNTVWDAWVAPGETPTRCCGKVELNDPKCLVEIVAVAAL